jgi:hypothetical protein
MERLLHKEGKEREITQLKTEMVHWSAQLDKILVAANGSCA